MSYAALYRKYRPKQFCDVKGQDHIVTTLRNQIMADRIGHAYLFTGTRGTGKTTVAKIFAQAVNCENPSEDGPCNECDVCKSIKAKTSLNVIEIDAASNNGVDNVREIIEEVRYSPTEGKYKVYIIDEVHMLSAGAFNALLKTLEEPPSYVIFILATTEVHKIPITILSRCQRYDFRRISVETVTGLLRELTTMEGVEAEEKALRYIAKVADGSARDGLSLLDQCIAFYFGQKLTYDDILDVLGAVDADLFSGMLRRILDGDVAGCLALIEGMVVEGRELGQFITEFIWYLRNLLLVKTTLGTKNASEANDASIHAELLHNVAEMVDLSSEHFGRLLEEAESVEQETVMRYLRILSELSGQLRYASRKRVLIEVAVIKLCKPSMETDASSLLGRIRDLEKQFEKGIVVKEVKKDSHKSVKKEKEEDKPKLPKALPEDLKKVAGNWQMVLNKLSPLTRGMMSEVIPSVSEDNELLLVFREEMELKYFKQEKNRLEEIKSVLQTITQKEIPIQTRHMPYEQAKEVVDITKIFKKVPIEVE